MNAKGLRTSIAVFQLVPASLAPVTFPRFPWCFLEWLYNTSSCSGRYACLVFTGTTVLFNLFTRGGSVKPTEDSLSITSDFDVSMVLPSSQGRRQMQLRLSLKSSIVSQLGRGRSLGSPFCHSRQKKTARRRNLLFCPSAGALAAGLSAKRRRWDAVPLGVIQ